MRGCVCAQCGVRFLKRTGCYNRAMKKGSPLYCSQTCAGLARRSDTRTPEQKKADKAEYDRRYREKNREILKAKKAAYFQANRDPQKEWAARYARRDQHVEYCRQPKYKAYKVEYDANRRASAYGPFAEAYKLNVALTKTIRERRIPR